MTKQIFPFSFDQLHPKEIEEFKKDFGGHYLDLVEVNPGNVIMPRVYETIAEQMYNFPMRPDDVWVCGMKKTGTTWLQEAVWCIRHDVNLDKATSEGTYARVYVPETAINRQMFEMTVKYLQGQGQEVDGSSVDRIIELQSIEKFEPPRTIKCHFALHLLPPTLLDTCKVVYIARNPKDTCVSTYHNSMNFNVGRQDLPFGKYAKWYFRNRVEGGPYWQHVREAWNKRNHPNLLFLKYEDMKENIRGTLHTIAHFLEKRLSEKQMSDLVNHLSFENIKKNPTTNMETLKDMGLYKEGEGRHFIRKGIVGDWVNHANPELDKFVDEWCLRERGSCTIHFPGVPLPSRL